VATIYDIAKKVGMTAATVSNALNGKGNLSEATRHRILQVAQEMGYRPNLIARSLAQRRSQTIALSVPYIANPFYGEIAATTEVVARGYGVRTLIVHTNEDYPRGDALIDDLVAQRVEGIIVMPGGGSPKAIRTAIQAGVQVVCLEWEEEDEIPAPSVGIDFLEVGRLAACHLLELGHRRIGLIAHGFAKGYFNHRLRAQGFSEVLRETGIEVSLQFGKSTAESGKKAAYALLGLPEPPTAIFATNDLMAIGALAAIWEKGYSVPDEISVMGFDDIEMASFTHPALTTIRADNVYLVEQSLRVLFELIHKQEEVVLPPLGELTLMRRASTGPAPS
jgi:DNA-binding LacI/PurR family transcriptional regulator